MFLTERELAIVLSRSVSTLQSWRWSGKRGPKFIKHGQRVLYPVSEINDFLAQFQPVQSTSQAQAQKGGPNARNYIQ